MVRAGRRVRTLVASVKPSDDCNSPKRKDQRLEFPLKLSHNSLQITDFFQVVQEHETKIALLEQEVNDNLCSLEVVQEVNDNICSLEIQEEIVEAKIPEIPEDKTSSTPHRIELCPETASPTNSLSQLTINIKKPTNPKAKRRLNVNQTQNQILKTSKDDLNTKSHTLTEYFPVRRSVRKTKRTVLEEKQKTLEEGVRSRREKGLEVHNFPGKGRGIVACQHFAKGDFVVEYRGELIDLAEAKRREIQYAQDQNTGCYMYYFKHKNQQYCVDATAESSFLGRLVNHSRNGNLVTKTLSVDGIPRLVLIAKDDIQPGEEVTYDYGDRSKESLKYHPWLAT